MNEVMYLLDNNVLSHLARRQCQSAFFLEHCRISSEVLHESSGHRNVDLFKQIEYPTTSHVLELLAKVMTSVPVSDTTLVNLYSNKGAADPLLVACALDATETVDEGLWGPTWIIASHDKAVRAKAAEFRIEAITREDFLERASSEWD